MFFDRGSRALDLLLLYLSFALKSIPCYHHHFVFAILRLLYPTLALTRRFDNLFSLVLFFINVFFFSFVFLHFFRLSSLVRLPAVLCHIVPLYSCCLFFLARISYLLIINVVGYLIHFSFLHSYPPHLTHYTLVPKIRHPSLHT